VIVRFVEIGGIGEHHYLNYHFITVWDKVCQWILECLVDKRPCVIMDSICCFILCSRRVHFV